jgi:Peptidase family C25
MMHLFLSLVLTATHAAERPNVVVVCAPEFREVLMPWVLHREQQATLRFLTPQSSEKLQQQIREIHKAATVSHIVLVGDVDARAATSQVIGPPTFRLPAKVNVLFGSEPHYGSDMPYADLDDDNIPDVAIGRLAVKSNAQLKTVVEKILFYEQNRDFGDWRQRVNLVAGVGGFGTIIDSTLEMTTKQFLCDGIPAGYNTHMTYGSWRSPYCPDPAKFQDSILQQYNRGSLFWVYIGHGHPERLDRIHVPGAAYPILDQRDISKLRCENGLPIAVLLACYTGAYDLQRDCLAEEMLRTPGGPVAVLAGSRITMPYAMSVLTHELMRSSFSEQHATLGEIILHAKQNSLLSVRVQSSENSTSSIGQRQWIDALGKLLSPKPDLLNAELAEHVGLFNLVGDPLLKIAYPQTVKIETPAEARAGDILPLRLSTPVAGKCTLQLVCRRDCLTIAPPARDTFAATPAAMQLQQHVYEKANDNRYAEHVMDMQPGTFDAEILIPAHATGFCQVRVFMEGKSSCALGGSDVYIHRANRIQTAKKPLEQK